MGMTIKSLKEAEYLPLGNQKQLASASLLEFINLANYRDLLMVKNFKMTPLEN